MKPTERWASEKLCEPYYKRMRDKAIDEHNEPFTLLARQFLELHMAERGTIHEQFITELADSLHETANIFLDDKMLIERE